MSEAGGAAPLRVVGVRFSRAGKLSYFDAGELVLNVGDEVVAPGDPLDAGPRTGRVAFTPEQVIHHPFVDELPRLLGRKDRKSVV